ncbi:ABC transporter transmembrane region 2-domain-containing protein [Scenedesmus sp. NREL 46B-D3]|nr:ABC transporter transmembrane region 2-domain-containing protein [Scenedesmus sp. NREL 46B-D3]
MAQARLLALTPNQKRAVAVAVVFGGLQSANQVRKWVKAAQNKQKELVKDIHGKQTSRSKNSAKIAVNEVFFKRLCTILSICVPGLFTREAFLVLVQGVLLVSRTLLTDYISRVEGYCGRALTSLEFASFGRGVVDFALLGVPAAIVNSGLKFMQKNLELSFQSRLTLYLHKLYTSNRAYYAASTLGGLTHADQRITEDVEKFCFSISDLYSHTFKPLLDVLLFTHSLSRVMGYKGQLALYAYYMCVAWLLRALAPPLASMTAQESALVGAFRAAHQRLVAHSEEVAFNDPPGGAAEQLILNQHLARLTTFSRLSSFQRFLQQIADGYFVKYFASCVALLVYAGPIYFMNPASRGDQGQLTADYIRSMRLLQNTSRGVGDLIMVYKRMTSLAGHTSRVSELLEQVKLMSSEDIEHKELFRRNLSQTNLQAMGDQAEAELLDKFKYGEHQQAQPLSPVSPRRSTGETISFHRVALDAPDGMPLVRELSFEVRRGCSVMLMGPNGCGKSSLFRVLAGLWPLQAGEIVSPPKSELFYLSQRPYLLVGSLRDQLLYPKPPARVWAGSKAEDKQHFVQVAGEEPQYSNRDAELEECLAAVELDYLLARGQGWDSVQSWQETLSGGEKQRLAMARLLFHKPAYAVLDECTSAVSADGEVKLYEACIAAGITLLSIAHRPTLKRFHQLVVHIDGTVSTTGRGWWTEVLDEKMLSSSSSAALAAIYAAGGQRP